MAEVDPINEVRSREVEDEEGKAGADEEDTGAQIAPIVKLEEVLVPTGEENEDVLFHMKCKLYRFDKGGNQWKERGVGAVKLLKNKESGKVRLVMRQAKTLKICANHLVLPSTSIQEHAGNEKSCVWHATDFSDGELKEELFCMRFGTLESAKKFMEIVEEIAEHQARKSEEEDEAAIALKGLNVGDQNDDNKGVKEQLKENVKEEDLKGEKPETKGEKKGVENLEIIRGEREVRGEEKPEIIGEEKEVRGEEKPETKREKEEVEKLEIIREEKEVRGEEKEVEKLEEVEMSEVREGRDKTRSKSGRNVEPN